MDDNKIREIRRIRENPRFRHYPEYKESSVEWIGDIPAHWEVKRLKHVAKILPSNVDKHIYPDEIQVRLCNYTDVYYNDYITVDTVLQKGSCKESEFTKFVVREGDVIITKDSETPDDIGVPTFVKEDLDDVVCGYHLTMIRPLACRGEFIFRFIQSDRTRRYFEVNSNGITRYGLGKSSIENLLLPIPTDSEQTQIATFLDRKTEQIDELIRIKERRIELLQEQRTALINQAVTKGLDPNVEMKPSGVAWIGEIPTHWDAVPLTKYLESIIDYRGRTPEKTEGGRFLVTARNIRDGQIDYEISREFTSEDEYRRIMTRGIPQIGDLLFTTEAPLGEVANVDDVSIALAQRIIKFRPKQDFLNPYFLKYWMLSYSFQFDLQRYATGSTARGIKASKLCLLKLNLPSLKEQQKIVGYLDQKTQETNQLIAAEQRKIQLLQEYRQSVISEAVTGKIDVRSEV